MRESLKSLGITNFIIVALDQDTYKSAGSNSYFHPYAFKDKRGIWMERVKLISEVVSAGINCLHADADSIFLKNPFEYLSELNSDIFFGQGSVYPKHIFDKQKFVVRGGLHYTISNPTTKDLWCKFSMLTAKLKDDQVALNEYLYTNANWSKISNNQYDLKYLAHKYRGFNDPLYGSVKDASICLLPHHLFSRYYTEGDLIMYHKEK